VSSEWADVHGCVSAHTMMVQRYIESVHVSSEWSDVHGCVSAHTMMVQRYIESVHVSSEWSDVHGCVSAHTMMVQRWADQKRTLPATKPTRKFTLCKRKLNLPVRATVHTMLSGRSHPAGASRVVLSTMRLPLVGVSDRTIKFTSLVSLLAMLLNL
jgi:hypothetical protein